MQGYVTSEPFAIEQAAHFTPKVFLLADEGLAGYSTLIETRRDLVDKKPDLVQRFVDASTIGWYNYIYHDNSAANALIKKQNPEMTDDLLAYSVAAMKKYGIVDSGDASTLGIGAMTDARMKNFFDEMARAGVVRPEPRLPQCLHAAIRRQEGRARICGRINNFFVPSRLAGEGREGGRKAIMSARENFPCDPYRLTPPHRGERNLVVALRGVGKTFPSGTLALSGFRS